MLVEVVVRSMLSRHVTFLTKKKKKKKKKKKEKKKKKKSNKAESIQRSHSFLIIKEMS